ncbi:hypothetical protein BAE44_0008066 [Dichanthelium oligosanthes]|uniref:Sister chromatid cohesion 1 protein 2 n=1 Tax=Dichanthelium oligosanthes TaxID=888268 RepID=A0A1E5W0R1_9POAL|nr:hypothetical protein BAE44_0008066 [Dichanthelium oligosanthes]
MFYSKALLSMKGPLGTVWVAAFCGEAALSRDQVARTDIVASVDKILSDIHGPHSISHRILAQLMFGVVRIYSKKVYYLYHDCEEIRSLQLKQCAEPSARTGGSTPGVLKQVNKAVRSGRIVAGHQDTSKVRNSVRAVRTTEVHSPTSSEGLSVRVETEVIVRTSVVIREARVLDDLPAFTIPKSFELDSFDLGIPEDTDDEGEDYHQSAPQDILLEDDRHHAPYFYERASCSYDVDSTYFMPEYITVPREVMHAIGEANNILDLSTKGDKPERESQNADSAWFTPVKDILPPDMMDMMAEANDRSFDPSDKCKTGDNSTREVNMDENNGGSAYSRTPIPLQESQEGQNSENILENMTCGSLSASNPTIEASANDSLLGKSNTAPPAVEFPEHDSGEHESLEARVLRCETRIENELSPSTPEPMLEGVPGPSSSSRFRLRTPAKTEKSQATRKRRRALYNKEDYIPTEREGRRRVRRRLTWSYDAGTVLSNVMLREAIEDASDLVQQRRKAPHTHLDAWKVAKVGSLPYTFMDPLIPCRSHIHTSLGTIIDVNFKGNSVCPLILKEKTSTPLARVSAPEEPESSWEESARARRRLSYENTEFVYSCKDTGSTERESTVNVSRKGKLDERTDFEAPVGCHTESGPVQDGVCECHEDTAKEKGTQFKGDESSSEIPTKKGLQESENQIPLHNEAVNERPDFKAPVGCHTESGPAQDGVCECHEDTDKEKGTQVKGDEPSSEIPLKKGLHESENQIPLHNEVLNAALDNIDEDIPIYEEHTRDEGLLNSTRTRKIASCFHQLFLDQKSKKGTNSLSLNQVLEGRKKRTSATFFYETLILKSRGLIEVNQEQPYEDIILSPTPQLEAELQRCGN